MSNSGKGARRKGPTSGTVDVMTSARLIRALEAGLQAAAALAEPSSIAIVDRGGNVVAFVQSDGAAFGTTDVALGKAFTAAAFKVRTEALLADSLPGGETYGLVTAGGARPFVVFGGGIPVLVRGTCVGAVGVSGGPVARDITIAECVVAALQGASGQARDRPLSRKNLRGPGLPAAARAGRRTGPSR